MSNGSRDLAAPATSRSNPVSVFVSQAQGAVSVFANNATATTFVISFMTLIPRTQNTGDTCFIFLTRGNVALHSANVGTGVEDRFPLSCEIAIETGDSLIVDAVQGSWDAVVTGRYEPTLFAIG